jgi:hypothetical protein
MGFPGQRDSRRAMAQLVLAGAPNEAPAASVDALTYVRALVLDPVYQLK